MSLLRVNGFQGNYLDINDWLLQDCSEVIFDCNSTRIPHKHAMNKIIAQKIENGT